MYGYTGQIQNLPTFNIFSDLYKLFACPTRFLFKFRSLRGTAELTWPYCFGQTESSDEQFQAIKGCSDLITVFSSQQNSQQTYGTHNAHTQAPDSSTWVFPVSTVWHLHHRPNISSWLRKSMLHQQTYCRAPSPRTQKPKALCQNFFNRRYINWFFSPYVSVENNRVAINPNRSATIRMTPSAILVLENLLVYFLALEMWSVPSST